MAKTSKSKPKTEKAVLKQISLSLMPEDIALIDSEAEIHGRTRAGQVRFFLSQFRSTAVHN